MTSFYFYMHFQAKNENFGELAGRRRDAAPRGSGALRGDVAVVLGMSADFVKTWIYPAGWVADKTAGAPTPRTWERRAVLRPPSPLPTLIEYIAKIFYNRALKLRN